jgi:hypothetical protein
MKRFLTIVAATAVAAAITIPAVADDGPADELGAFATCLRTHGIPVPAGLEGVAIKQWIGDHQDTAGLEAAFEACDPNPRQGDKADHAAPEKLVACLRTKGLTPPAALDDLKPWVFEQSKTDAGKAALNACGFAGVEDKRAAGGGGCGADKAEASRARKPKARTTPTT